MLYVSRTTAVFYKSASDAIFLLNFLTKTHKNLLEKPYWNFLVQFWLRQFSHAYLLNQAAPCSVPARRGGGFLCELWLIYKWSVNKFV